MINRSPSTSIIQNSLDRKSTRLNSSHQIISYAVFCLKKKTIQYRIYAVALIDVEYPVVLLTTHHDAGADAAILPEVMHGVVVLVAGQTLRIAAVEFGD